MKQIYLLIVVLAGGLLSGCGGGSDRGELTGVPQRSFRSEVPYGMVYIPGGTFLMGQTDQDVTFAQIAQTKQVTLAPFFMDQTEITNSQYKQFVYWVRDSIAITNYVNDNKYYIQPKGTGTNANSFAGGKKFINWAYVKRNPIWSNKKGQAGNASKLQGMYYQGDDRVFDRNEIDIRILKYNYSIMVLRDAANYKNDKTKRRSDFILRDTVAVYPDTLVWLSDFSYAANEPMVEGYFSHPAFRNYPVVGVTWRQARAFTVWRTRYNDAYKDTRRLPHRLPYELPTEAEFEYAARGGRVGTDYPWGGPYIKNAKGCLLANFKPGRGNYTDDGGAYTVNVRSYFPNDYGLYNMAGNVAEWTSSTFDESASSFVHDLAPTFNYEAKSTDPEVLKRKVVRGGSWKDIGYFLQNATRTYEYQDTAKSYIGFRCVTQYLGRDIKDKR
jgi:gliding motility-associated lipoprotein GldK